MGIYLSHARCEIIKRIVVDLFVEYDVTSVPVNGFELAKKMGIGIVPYTAIPIEKRHLFFKKSEDGFCAEKTHGEWRIYYNDGVDYRRINNTIMHEIGHIVLDHSEDSELAEKEVRFFAKYALVPPVLVHKFKLSDSYAIADVFGVSSEAACYALSYYNKWLRYGCNEYTDYEVKLLQLFKIA